LASFKSHTTSNHTHPSIYGKERSTVSRTSVPKESVIHLPTSMMAKKRPSLLLLLFLLLLFDLLSLVSPNNLNNNINKNNSNGNDYGSSNSHNKGSNINPRTTMSKKTSSSSSGSGGGLGIGALIEVYEHEHFDTQRNTWIGGSGSSSSSSSLSTSKPSSSSSSSQQRWTSSPTNDGDSTTKHMSPPPQILAPEGYQFTSNWNIDVSGGNKDELGWEYFVIGQQSESGEGVGPKRRSRHWLRTYAMIPTTIIPTTGTTTTTQSKSSLSSKATTTPRPLPSSAITKPKPNYHHHPKIINLKNTILRPIYDSFNFKGYGLTFFKSLVSLRSFGLSLRLPLTTHFDLFDRRPWLPLCNLSGGMFYNSKDYLAGCVVLSASLPVEVVRWGLGMGLDWGVFVGKDLLVGVLGRMVWRVVVGVWR